MSVFWTLYGLTTILLAILMALLGDSKYEWGLPFLLGFGTFGLAVGSILRELERKS